MIRTVLKIDIQRYDDNYSIAKIEYQDCNIFERGEFNDRELKVSSQSIPNWNNFNQELFLRGKNEEKDNRPFIVPNEDVELLIDRLNKINEKYGGEIASIEIERVTRNQSYYFINRYFEVIKAEEWYTKRDNLLYETQNYFIDKTEAEVFAEYLKEKTLEFRKGWQNKKGTATNYAKQ